MTYKAMHDLAFTSLSKLISFCALLYQQNLNLLSFQFPRPAQLFPASCLLHKLFLCLEDSAYSFHVYSLHLITFDIRYRDWHTVDSQEVFAEIGQQMDLTRKFLQQPIGQWVGQSETTYSVPENAC